MIRIQDIEWPGAERLSVSEVDALFTDPLANHVKLLEALDPQGSGGIELNIHHSTLPLYRKTKPLVAAYYGSRQLDSGVGFTYLRVPINGHRPTLRKKRRNEKRLRIQRETKVIGATKDGRGHQGVRGL